MSVDFSFFFISTTHETVVCRVLLQLLLFVYNIIIFIIAKNAG